MKYNFFLIEFKVSIFVGNLPFRAEREDVLELFAPFGEVINCSLPLERDTGRKRGFAFIEMADEALESTVIESLQGSEMMGRPLRINKAEPRGNSPRRNNNNSRQYNGGGYNAGQNGGYRESNNSNAYNNNYNAGYSSTNNLGGDQNSNFVNRTSGAKGWEDRSYSNNSDNSEYENSRSRRRRGGSNELDDNPKDS